MFPFANGSNAVRILIAAENVGLKFKSCVLLPKSFASCRVSLVSLAGN